MYLTGRAHAYRVSKGIATMSPADIPYPKLRAVLNVFSKDSNLLSGQHLAVGRYRARAIYKSNAI